MRKWIIIVLCATIALPAVAEDHKHGHDSEHHGEHHPGYVSEILEEMLEGNGDTPLGDITLEEAGNLISELSIAVQKEAFIGKSRAASFMHPGAGQFMNGDTGSGLLFLSAEILVSAGTLVGSYFLLPEDLQFGSIDYLNDSYASIEAAWMDKSFVDLLPSMGVMAGGMVVDFGLRAFSAYHAGMLAIERIEAGEVDFEPRLLLTPGSIGMGVKMGRHQR